MYLDSFVRLLSLFCNRYAVIFLLGDIHATILKPVPDFSIDRRLLAYTPTIRCSRFPLHQFNES